MPLSNRKKGRRPEQAVKLGRGNFIRGAQEMTVQILERDQGYQVKASTFEHLFLDKSKALLVAQVVALKEATDLGRSVAIVLPESWGQEPIIEDGLP